MYLDHFGLREPPFRITPHTEFFFSGANRGATLEALIYAITHDEGIVKVTGEVGSGKTMLCRMLLERLPREVETVYLANPSLSRDEIRQAIADELGITLPEGRNHLLLRALQEQLIEIYASGRQVVLMIDEAHAMPSETLEEIRLLSNLESTRHKLLHIVLFGQPELDTRLQDNAMRPLKERITHNFALSPLHSNEIGTYLMFRLRAAGYKGPDLFTAQAIQLINTASEGLTRRINILADKALLAAYAENTHQIDARLIKAAILDAQFRPIHPRTQPRTLWAASAGAAAVLLGGLVFATLELPDVSRGKSSPAEPPSLQAAPGKTPTAETKTAVASANKVESPSSAPAPNEPPAPITLADRLMATETWLRSVPDSRYVIQLLSTDASGQREVESYLATCCRSLDKQQLRVYRSNLSGRDRFGVIYGDYASREAAAAELGLIARQGNSPNAYARPISKLR